MRHRVLEFLAAYGEKGYSVLKAAVEVTLNNNERRIRLGDFNYKELVRALSESGVNYNPSMLLRILERDYEVIETSYKSGNQHWWRFVDLAAVLDALEEYERGEEPSLEEKEEEQIGDPKTILLRAQFAALGVGEVIEKLARLAEKKTLTKQDRLVFSRIAFSSLEAIASLYERMLEYEEEFEEEIKVLAQALSLASRVARKIALVEKTRSRKVGKRLQSLVELEAIGD